MKQFTVKQPTRQLCLLLALLLCLTAALLGCNAPQIDDAVYVSVSVKGETVLTYAAVALADEDGDGALTLNDALIAAHREHCAEGADGYASVATEYGQTMTRLWGDESGAYGYMRNDAPVASSLLEPIEVGDHVYAYVYADQENWSDTYCYFDKTDVTVSAGDTVTLTLMSAGFDENWAPVTLPLAGATVVINGEALDTQTNAQGEVTITMGEKSKKDAFVVSATHPDKVIVPPVCLITVE